MSDNVAVLAGYTKQVIAYPSNELGAMYLLIKPDTALDSRFKAWDSDNQEYVFINGWLFTFEDIKGE